MGKRRPAKVPPPKLRHSLHTALPDHTVDLHGLRAREAVLRVENVLETWVRRQPGAVLRIITGRGNRSPDGPILRGAMEELLRNEVGERVADLALDSGGGGWLVRVKGP